MTTNSHDDDRGDAAARSIVETTLISLDGHVADPMSFARPYFDGDAQADALELLQAHDAIVFGRRTFEALGAAWPASPASSPTASTPCPSTWCPQRSPKPGGPTRTSSRATR